MKKMKKNFPLSPKRQLESLLQTLWVLVIIILSQDFMLEASSNPLYGWSEARAQDMTTWLKETYIEKLSGEWVWKLKNYKVPGFTNGWEMFHLHHVCTHGGEDGLYVNMEGK